MIAKAIFMALAVAVLAACNSDTNTLPPESTFPEVPETTWQRPFWSSPDLIASDEVEAVEIDPGVPAQSVVDLHPAGTTYRFTSGTHYETEIVPKDGDIFLGSPDAVLSGARLARSWVGVDGLWVTGGFDQEGEDRGSCVDSRPSCTFPEDVFFDDEPLFQVLERSRLEPGTWYFDKEADSIYLFDDPNGHKVEVSVVPYAFHGSSEDVMLSGLVIEKYATPAQRGAIGAEGTGRGWIVVDNEVRLVHGTGIKAGAGTQVIGNYLHHNGQLGLSASGEGVLVEGNEIFQNNIGGFNPYWGGGGAKFVLSTGLRVVDNYVHHNFGPGLWTDIDNIDTHYEGNLIVANLHAGIKHEISYDATITDNWVEANGFGNPNNIAGAGIFVSSSPNVEVWGNTVIGNRHGIGGLVRDRGEGKHGPYELRNLYVHDNEITMTDGYTGVMSVSGKRAFSEWNIQFESNRYLLTSEDDSFHWRGQPLTFVEWNQYGLDLEGSTSSAPATSSESGQG